MSFIEKFLMPDRVVIAEWVIIACVAVISILATRSMKEVPGKLQNVVETGISKLFGFFEGVMGTEHAREFFPVLGTLFIFIMISNYSGELPGAGHIFTVPTSQLGATVGLGIVAFLTIHTAGIRKQGLGGYLKSFLKPVAPLVFITILETFVRPLSLALRLYGNIYGEDMVTETLAEMFPLFLPWIMNILSLLFCLIQAMIFTMLTAIFIGEAVEEEEEKPKKIKQKNKKKVIQEDL